MAVKVSNTTVIDNSRNFINITGAEGIYGDFQPTAYSPTSGGASSFTWNPSFDRPLNHGILTGASMTIGGTNLGAGKQTIILLDTSTSGYDVSWSAAWNWPEDTEPTWTTARYWMITGTCWDVSTIRATVTSWGA